MPHQCTDCGTVFDDGSTEMLSGCPQCGGNTFQYLPDGATADADPPTESTDEPPERPAQTGSVAQSVGSAAQTVRNLVAGSSDGAGTDPESADPLSPWTGESQPGDRTGQAGQPAVSESSTSEAPVQSTDGQENAAQASARSAVVSPDELPAAGTAEMAAGTSPPSQSDSSSATGEDRERPDLETLREELNDQFESIRIVEPGQYELNLMELYERDEYIIALQEDGRYRIQVPESW